MKNSWFAALDESSEDLMKEAQELFRLVEAGNSAAIEEVRKGVKADANWRYAGIIYLDKHGHFAIRDPKEPLRTSGPVPLSSGVFVKS